MVEEEVLTIIEGRNLVSVNRKGNHCLLKSRNQAAAIGESEACVVFGCVYEPFEGRDRKRAVASASECQHGEGFVNSRSSRTGLIDFIFLSIGSKVSHMLKIFTYRAKLLDI